VDNANDLVVTAGHGVAVAGVAGLDLDNSSPLP
jgi:hypothetical protein